MASFNQSIIVISDNPNLEPKIRVKMLLSNLIISLVCSMPAFAWKLPVGEFHFEKMVGVNINKMHLKLEAL